MTNPVSTDLRFEHEFGCLVIRATGRYLIEHKEVSILAMVKAIKDQPVHAALLDIRGLERTYSFMDRYELAELAGRYLTQVPMGVLGHVEQLDPRQIGVLVARNRGVNLKVFTDPVEAQAWLKKQSLPERCFPRENTKTRGKYRYPS